MPKAEHVASYLISVSKPSTPWSLTPLKLQKLLYYCQGWYMAYSKGERLFEDDLVAWEHGPVVQGIYHIYKKYGYLTITPEPFDNLNENGKQIFTQTQLDVITAVWETYGQYDGKYLEELTHQEDPWLDTPKDGTITDRRMLAYFSRLAQEA